MNQICESRIAERFLAAIEKENVTQTFAAEKLGFDKAYVTFLKREDNHNKISDNIWNLLKTFVNSGESFASYNGEKIERLKSPLTLDLEPGPMLDFSEMVINPFSKRAQFETGSMDPVHVPVKLSLEVEIKVSLINK